MMAEILYASKHVKKGQGVPLDDVVRVFESSNNIEEINVVVKQAAERVYVSWASVDVKDKASERIPIEELAKTQDALLRRHGPITDEHTNRVVGETLAYKIMQHPQSGALGVLHLNKIHADSKFDDQIWSEIQNGLRKGSSVGGYNEESELSIGPDGSQVKVLRKFNQYETATVFNPCNPLALNEAVSVVAKSAKNLPAEEENAGTTTVPEPPIPPGFNPGEELPESVIKEGLQEEPIDAPVKDDEVEPTMNEEIQKAFDSLNSRIDLIEKHVVKAEKEEEKPKDEEKKEDEKPVEKAAPEEKKEEDEKKEEEKPVEKACDEEKKDEDKKEKEEDVAKSAPVTFQAERPVLAEVPAQVAKTTLDPLAIATGQVKKTWTELREELKTSN